jgi:hypothetical protein
MMIPVQVYSSVHISQARQWTEVATSPAHPALIRFPLKGKPVIHLEVKENDNLLQFLNLFLDDSLIGVILDDKICLSVPTETCMNC